MIVKHKKSKKSSKKSKSKSAVKKGPRQPRLPGMEDAAISAIEDAAADHADIRSQQATLRRELKAVETRIRDAMHKANKLRYVHGETEIELDVQDEKVRVRIRKQKEEEEDDSPEDGKETEEAPEAAAADNA